MSKEKHYDKWGRKTGESEQRGDTIKHYDRFGRKAGESEQHGNTIKHYDKWGRKTGESTQHGDTAKHYDRWGRKTGESEKRGDTTKHYDHDGRRTGESVKSSGGCFITTACVKAKGLPDNCFELKTLRTFRERYLKSLPYGEKIIHEYYNIAPRIIAAINSAKHPEKIYLALYKSLVLKSVRLICLGRRQKALENYLRVVSKLKKKYLN